MDHKNMGDNKVVVGNVTDISGEVNIAGRDIYKGYTASQVSVLLTQITSTFQPRPFDGRCPYKGLDIFEEEDAELFFGREKLVDDLVSRVKESRTVFVTGPSGSGKSSLVRAGLIHALRQGAIKSLHSERWLYGTMRPGREPLAALAQLTSGLAGSTSAGDEICAKGPTDGTIFARWCEIALKDSRDKRAVIFVDQFEEIFTQIGREEQRLTFINLLAHAATAEQGRVIILIAMRSDFLSNCAAYPVLNKLLSQQFIQIGAMHPEELVSAIARPALQVGLRVDPDLIAQIINDMEGQPGILPLMQFALKDLFDAEQEKGGVIALTLEEYLHRGGLQKSLEQHADGAFAGLSAPDKQLARSIFSGLIEVGRGTQDTRRTAFFEELIPENSRPEEVEAIVRKLADARLVIIDEQAGRDIVTISHEKLIDSWPWLKKLVNENREAIALQNDIARDAKEWADNRRDTSYLYTGARLFHVREQLASKRLVLSGLAQEFVLAGRMRQQRSQTLLIAGISIIIGLLVIAVILFRVQSIESAATARTAEAAKANAVTQWAIAETAKANADAQRAIAEAAQATAIAGRVIAQTAEANAQLNEEEAKKQARIARVGELAAQSVAMEQMDYQISSLLAVEAFRLGDTVQSRGALLDAAITHSEIRAYLKGHTGLVQSVAFSPDGKTLASASEDGTLRLWDVETLEPIGQPLLEHTKNVFSVAFSPDGKMLASGSGDTTIILWDAETRQPIGQPLSGHTKDIFSVAFSPDGKTLASGSDGSIILWDLETRPPIGQPLQTGLVWGVAFSPDGKMLASGSYADIILWDLDTRKPIGEPLRGHTSYVNCVTFSPDGKTLASGSWDSNITLWDLQPSQPTGLPLPGYSGSVQSIAFSPDGKMLAISAAGGIISLWDVQTRQQIGQSLSGNSDPVMSVAFSPDGKTLASGGDGATIILWDLDPQSWVEKSCAYAWRNFTLAEWERYFPKAEPYRKTCDQWPLEGE